MSKTYKITTCTYKVLSAMLALDKFTVNGLARYSGVVRDTIYTVINRNRSLLDELGKEGTGQRGGQPIRYQIKPDKVNDLRAQIIKEFADIKVLSEVRAQIQTTIETPLGLLVAEDALLRLFPHARNAEERQDLLELATLNIDSGNAELAVLSDEAVLDSSQINSLRVTLSLLETLKVLSEAELAFETNSDYDEFIDGQDIHAKIAEVFNNLAQVNDRNAAVFGQRLINSPLAKAIVAGVFRQGFDIFEHVSPTQGLKAPAASLGKFGGMTGSHFNAAAGHVQPLDTIAVVTFPGKELAEKYISEGFNVGIVDHLSVIQNLMVKGPSYTSLDIAAATATPQEARTFGRRLNVNAVLMNEMHRFGKHLYCHSRLIDVAKGSPIWTDTVQTENLSDLIKVQENISKAVSKELNIELTDQEKKLLAKRPTEDPEAYQLYLQGQYHWRLWTLEGVKKGMEYFNKALGKDPRFARAHAGLADCYNMLAYSGEKMPWECFTNARGSAIDALEYDRNLAEAYTSLAYSRARYYWKWKEAEQEFKSAIGLNPNYTLARLWYAEYLAAMERFDEAAREIDMAYELDPFSLIVNVTRGTIFYFMRQYDQAIEQFKKTLELDPHYVRAHSRLGGVYVETGMYDEAISHLSKAVELSSRNTREMAALGHAYAASGNRIAAENILGELEELLEGQYVSQYNIALIYARLGESEQALARLQRACDLNDPWMVFLKIDPRLDNLRDLTIFTELIEQVGLPGKPSTAHEIEKHVQRREASIERSLSQAEVIAKPDDVDLGTIAPKLLSSPFAQVKELNHSIWYDGIRRAMLESWDLQNKVDEDYLCGVTSNLTVFEKALIGSTDYDDQIRSAINLGINVEDIYEFLIVDDIGDAANVLMPTYERTEGRDGYVSFEPGPWLADKAAIIENAERLFEQLNRKNVLIKIPASSEFLQAIEELIYRGVNVDATMIFSIEKYAQVAEAFIRGLERRAAEGKPVSEIASVTSFSLSRLDNMIDSDLEYRGRHAKTEEEKKLLESLVGKVAIANAKLVYQKFEEIFYSERFSLLKAKGAQFQRLMLTSTGTNNPKYSDVLYVEQLLGPNVIAALPPATYTAFRDHGKVSETLAEGLDESHAIMTKLTEIGIDLKEITDNLQCEEMGSLPYAFDALIEAINIKHAAFVSGVSPRLTASLGKYVDLVGDIVKEAEKENVTRRIWRKDASLWTDDEAEQEQIKNSMGWLTMPQVMVGVEDDLIAFSNRIRGPREFKHIMVCGMGGASLCAKVLLKTFGKREGYPELLVLDSTDPDAFSDVAQQIDLTKCLFVISSKSGTTIESIAFYDYWYDQVSRRKENPGECFIAITDPGTPLEQRAISDGFKRIFLNPADLSGGYSALSYFGMVPAALMGIDLKRLLDRARRVFYSCAPVVPIKDNPGVRLGAIMSACARDGRNKLTISIDPKISTLGSWIEQLVAESTGKEGNGIVPIIGEPIKAPSFYGNDRLFVSICDGQLSGEAEESFRRLEEAGHPVIYRALGDLYDLGEEFFLWEFATAFACWRLGINPFTQPDFQDSKDAAEERLALFLRDGSWPQPEVVASDEVLTMYTAGERDMNGKDGEPSPSTIAALQAHLMQAGADSYIALLNYIEETPKHEAIIQMIRRQLEDAMGCATTAGYGPRFLHSTGQLHKGGPASGIFLQITAPDINDLPIVKRSYTFSILKQAQAAGDFHALTKHGRRILQIDLGPNPLAGLHRLHEVVRGAVRRTAENELSEPHNYIVT